VNYMRCICEWFDVAGVTKIFDILEAGNAFGLVPVVLQF